MVEPAAFDVGRRLFTPVGRVNIFWKLHLVESQRVFIPFRVETLFFLKKIRLFGPPQKTQRCPETLAFSGMEFQSNQHGDSSLGHGFAPMSWFLDSPGLFLGAKRKETHTHPPSRYAW